jgi:hypothetical protein
MQVRLHLLPRHPGPPHALEGGGAHRRAVTLGDDEVLPVRLLAAGEAILLLCLEDRPQLLSGDLRQRHDPHLAVLRRVLDEGLILVLLDGAGDADEALGEVEVGPPEAGDLPDPQAGEAGGFFTRWAGLAASSSSSFAQS